MKIYKPYNIINICKCKKFAIAEVVNLIKINNLIKKYHEENRDLEVLKINSLKIKEEEQVSIVGPSGSGKTTLLKIISGLINFDNGKVNVLANDLKEMSEREKDRFRAENIGYIFQDLNLINSLTAKENLLLAPYLINKKVDADLSDKADRLLKEVGLEHRSKHIPEKLSQGERQRVAIARAMINDVKLILADEPTGNLDFNTGQNIIQNLRELCNKNKLTLILVTHDQEISSSFDRIIDIRKLNSAYSAGVDY